MNTKTIRIKLSKGTNPCIDKLLKYVLSKKFDNFTTLMKMRFLAETEFLQKITLNKKNYKECSKILETFDFSNDKNYENKKSPDFELTEKLKNFRDELLIVIDKKYNKDRVPQILVRQVSPPLSAYKMIGHTKIDIKSTGRDYGTLFES